MIHDESLYIKVDLGILLVGATVLLKWYIFYGCLGCHLSLSEQCWHAYLSLHQP